ncbi:pollen-specific leucine-rich repeat extensin-like protein 3 [Vigna radiata var. radiata]|uniref:Pollen-specific leucine-rich repeat extensin-like protein 3 n=1 Tax=Vigna radiata var. radiata TaxID=3916 RepID=A0A1S3VQC1_VIGRR|nr:pollen-specific leucine-rich repeat extensin-like protein 3 [Vigna radiata var. radiata]
MSISGIQGQPLEVTVVSCSKLKDTEWISRQDPYVCIEYGSTKFRTRTCTDGGKNPVFQEKFVFPLIEGLREINVLVWNSNTLTFDDFIGSGKIQLHKVLSQGFDDSAWPLQTKSGRYSGEVKVILHYAIANQKHKSGSGHAPSAPPYMSTSTPPFPSYSNPSLASSYPPPPYSTSSYPPHPSATPYHHTTGSYPPVASTASYPPVASTDSYPPVASTASYPPPPTAYPPHPSHSSPYPQHSYPASSPYPPSSYPPPHSYPPASTYPPSSYPPPTGYTPGIYPPPPY